MSRSWQRELREVPCGGRPESRASVQDPWRQCGAEAAERRTQRLRACLKRTSIGHVETMILGGGQGKRTVGGGKHVSRLICDVNPEGSWEKERTKKDGFDGLTHAESWRRKDLEGKFQITDLTQQ